MWPIFNFGVRRPTMLTLMLLAVKNKKTRSASVLDFCCWCLCIEMLAASVFGTMCFIGHSTLKWWWLSNGSGAAVRLQFERRLIWLVMSAKVLNNIVVCLLLDFLQEPRKWVHSNYWQKKERLLPFQRHRFIEGNPSVPLVYWHWTNWVAGNVSKPPKCIVGLPFVQMWFFYC